MDGSCLASPRWVSLLVAELFYPHARFPATKPGNKAEIFDNLSKIIIIHFPIKVLRAQVTEALPMVKIKQKI